MEQDVRWKQRFENFQRAIRLLQEIPELDLKKAFIFREGRQHTAF